MATAFGEEAGVAGGGGGGVAFADGVADGLDAGGEGPDVLGAFLGVGVEEGLGGAVLEDGG